jgi:hypothetical protein
MTCPSLQEPLQFDNYWVGPRFEGLYLVSVVRICTLDTYPVGNGVQYAYENCSEFDVGCDKRIEVQISSTPFSEEHRHSLDLYGKATNIDGVPGRFLGTQLAIYLPGTTVFVSSGDSVTSYEDDDERWYRWGRELRKGSSVLADLASHGIRFSSDCRGISRCEGESVSLPGPSQGQTLLNVGSVIVFVFLYGLCPFLIFRRRQGQPLFSRERRLFRLAIVFFAVSALVLYVLLRLSAVFVLPGLGLAIAAFLIAGASLRPRGGYGRGVALGTLTYLLIGLVCNAVLTGPESLAQFLNEESFLFVVLEWPAIPALLLAGHLGT